MSATGTDSLRARLNEIIAAEIADIPSTSHVAAVSNDILAAVETALLSEAALLDVARAIGIGLWGEAEQVIPEAFLGLARKVISEALTQAFEDAA